MTYCGTHPPILGLSSTSMAVRYFANFGTIEYILRQGTLDDHVVILLDCGIKPVTQDIDKSVFQVKHLLQKEVFTGNNQRLEFIVQTTMPT